MENTHTKEDIYAAASLACLELLPPPERESYVLDIRARYRAEPVIYLLQGLSLGATSIFWGLLTNYLYDRTKSRKNARLLKELKKSIEDQRHQLNQLREWISQSSEHKDVVNIRNRFDAYVDIQNKIERADPAIAAAVEDAIRQLEQRGAAALQKQVDASLRILRS